MNYNIHPILVHFPIALLLLYSLLRLFPWPKKLGNVDWQVPRIAILALGLLGASLASSTGELAAHLVRPDRQILGAHELMASATSWIYAIALVGEAALFVKREWFDNKYLSWFNPILSIIKKLFSTRLLFAILSVVGAAAITLTGLLGGVMVYGTSADPIAAPVLKLLGI